MQLSILLIVLSVLTISSAFAKDTIPEANAGYRVLKKVSLGGDGSWDYLNIDASSRRLYIGRSNRIMVVDVDTDSLIGEVAGINGAHGVALVPELKRGFATSGKDNTVGVFDLDTLKETAQVKAGQKPDAIIYDPTSKKVFAFNHGGTTATVIDPATATATGDIEIGGSPESAVVDDTGNLFVNLEDKSEIAVVDTKKLSVKAHWMVSPGTGPTGLAIDTQSRRLFSGCHNQLMVVLDADTGKVVTSLPIGKGVDAAGFDTLTLNAFSSNRDGTLTVIHETDPNSFSVIQNVQTMEGARTMAVDSKTHQIWLVSAQMLDAPTPAVPQDRQHKMIAPGSFTALIVGQ